MEFYTKRIHQLIVSQQPSNNTLATQLLQSQLGRTRKKAWLFELINTSVHHKQLNGNYGLYFRYWDRLMGTEHPDYVEVYDTLQAKRFAPQTTTETESKVREDVLRHPSST